MNSGTKTLRGAFWVSLAVSLAGCPDGGGRWERFVDGGRFMGAGPESSPGGTTIVFSSPETGQGDLYTHDLAAATRMQLTDDPNYEGDATYSADGSRIAFMRENSDEGRIWIMNADGSGAVQITGGPGYDSSPSFSPDGERIVFSRSVTGEGFARGSEASAEVFVIDTTGENELRLTNDREASFEPSFSPDGESILYDVWASDVWIMHSDGQDARRITTGASASFSPDGKRIVAVTGEYGREISVVEIEGSNSRAIVKSDRYLSHPTFLPDGERILYLEEPEASGIGDVRIVDIEGKESVVVATLGAARQ